jgi:hypothetical protein
MTDEWLDFIGKCRAGFVHEYDIVEGSMVDDTIWNFVNDFLAGTISRNAELCSVVGQKETAAVSFAW